MENKDFDKIFAHKFNQVSGEPYREAGWSDLSGRMDAYERRRRRWVLLIILPLLGLLAAGNVFWWMQWRALASEQHADVQHVNIIKNDTVVHSTVIYRYDTIYKYTTLVQSYTRESIQSRGSFITNETAPSVTSIPAVTDPESATRPHNGSTTEPTATETSSFTNTGTTTPGTTNNLVVQNTAVNPAPHSTSRRVPLTDTLDRGISMQSYPTASVADSSSGLLPKTPEEIKKTRRSSLSVSRARLGLSLGGSNPLFEYKTSGYLVGAGLSADMEIMHNLRLGADVGYWQGKMKAEETEGLRGVKIPKPGSDYRFNYWEIYKLPTISYAVYLKYYIPIHKPWMPWVGLGTQATTFLPYQIEFDFENRTNLMEIYLPAQAAAITRWHGMLMMLGMEGQLGPRFSYGAEAFLLKSFGEESSGIIDNQIGLKTRLFYNF